MADETLAQSSAAEGGFWDGVTFNSLLSQVTGFVVDETAAKSAAKAVPATPSTGTPASNAGTTATDYLNGAVTSLQNNLNTVIGVAVLVIVAGGAFYLIKKAL